MRLLKIRPWPFQKDEIVELFWLCSPYLNKNQNWMFTTSFKDKNNNVKDIKIPWGSLPNLVIGQGYKDGLPNESTKIGKVEEIDVSGLYDFKICNGFDMPHNLYYLFKNSLYGRQKVCKFNVQNRTFYVPCIEVIRFFLAPSKTLAYQLLKPHGLDFLIESISYPHKDAVQIDLSRDYPLRLANDDNVMHLLWLMTDKYAQITWNYVLRALHKKASMIHDTNPTHAFSMGLPIEARPPYMKKSKWTFRGITENKDTLIFEIMSTVGLNLKYNFVHYSHPDFYKPMQVNEPKTAKRTGNKEGNDSQLDQSQNSARKESNPSTIENAKLRYGFEGLYKIKRASRRTKKQRSGKHLGDKTIQGGNGEVAVTVSTQDWAYDGEIKSIEFKMLEVEDSSSTKGLEEFLKAIKYINYNYNELTFQLNIVFLPKGKSFSYYPGGHRRTCAIIKVEQENKLPCYILELGRADNWSISTLFIYPLSSLSTGCEDEKLFDRILNGIIDNNGHWDKTFIYQEQNYKFDMMKHVTNQSNLRWSERIVSKL